MKALHKFFDNTYLIWFGLRLATLLFLITFSTLLLVSSSNFLDELSFKTVFHLIIIIIPFFIILIIFLENRASSKLIYIKKFVGVLLFLFSIYSLFRILSIDSFNPIIFFIIIESVFFMLLGIFEFLNIVKENAFKSFYLKTYYFWFISRLALSILLFVEAVRIFTLYDDLRMNEILVNLLAVFLLLILSTISFYEYFMKTTPKTLKKIGGASLILVGFISIFYLIINKEILNDGLHILFMLLAYFVIMLGKFEFAQVNKFHKYD